MRILIVEDSLLVQQMYGLAFSRREHELTPGLNGPLTAEDVDGCIPKAVQVLSPRRPELSAG